MNQLVLFWRTVNKSFDRLRTNGYFLIPFVLSLSKHEWRQINLRGNDGRLDYLQ